MRNRSCVICNEEESEQSSHIELPCWNHWVCKDDLADFFVRATENESLYPPRCCDDLLLLDQFEQHVPQDVQVAFMKKAQGEYQILQKFRVYCANTTCTAFLTPAAHITDSNVNITYAICERAECGKVTCVSCRSLLLDGIENHICEVPEEERQFKQTAKEQGYQECSVCSRTVELAEACNHITCECGHSFCYVCGKDWQGLHGCPQYGRAEYDDEGYNQDGFHRDTDLNRDGLTRRQQQRRDLGEDDSDDEDDQDDDEQEAREEDMPDWDVLQHLDPDTRAVIRMLSHEERLDSLEMIRIQLMETRGITFGNHPEQVDDEDGNEDDDHDDEESESESEDGEVDEAAQNENNASGAQADPAEQEEATEHGDNPNASTVGQGAAAAETPSQVFDELGTAVPEVPAEQHQHTDSFERGVDNWTNNEHNHSSSTGEVPLDNDVFMEDRTDDGNDAHMEDNTDDMELSDASSDIRMPVGNSGRTAVAIDE